MEAFDCDRFEEWQPSTN